MQQKSSRKKILLNNFKWYLSKENYISKHKWDILKHKFWWWKKPSINIFSYLYMDSGTRSLIPHLLKCVPTSFTKD